MEQPIIHRTPATQLAAEGMERCRYCGCPLLAQYYFCVGCGTPYKHVQGVLSPSIPVTPTVGKLIDRKAPHTWPLFWSYLGGLLFAAIVAHFLGGGEDVPGYVFNAVVVLALTVVWGSIHWRSLAVQFGRIGFDNSWAWLCLAALPVVLVINYAWGGLWDNLLQNTRDPYEELRQGVGRGGVILLVCVLPAVLEEIAFRGLLQHWLQLAISPLMALVIASALFTALHFSVLGAPYLMLVGMLLGWAKYKTGSLYPSMLIHFLHNWAVVDGLV